MGNWFERYKNMPYAQRTSLHNKISMYANFAWAIMKLVFAYFISSYFLSLSGFYTICIAMAKCSYFDGRRNAKTQFKEEKYYIQIACALIMAGIVYLAYIFQIFMASHEQSYGLIISITIATVAFCELFFSIRGLIKTRNSKDLLLVGLKLTNVCSALSSIALTQVALLSMSEISNVLYNVIMGFIVGIITIIIGIIMFFYLYRFNKKNFFILKINKKYKINFKKLKFTRKSVKIKKI